MYDTKSVAEKPFPLSSYALSPETPFMKTPKAAESNEFRPCASKLAHIPANAS